MIESLFNQTNYQATKAMLDGTVVRQQAIAANISNVSSPGYKRVDLDATFQKELSRAIQTGDADRLKTLRPGLELDRHAVARTADGNTVNIESELLAMNQNFLENSLHTRMITGRLLKLRLAITGRP